MAANLRACGAKVRFDAHVVKLKEVIRKPWMVKVKPNPLRHTAVFSATAANFAKWHSKVFRRALIPEGKDVDWEEKRRLVREIKRVFR